MAILTLPSLLPALLLITITITTPLRSSAATLTLYNRCREVVWPGIQPTGGKEVVASGGLALPPGQAYSLDLPSGWSGRIWARQGCAFTSQGHGQCATGDCGSGLYCNGQGGSPPATLAELSLGRTGQDNDLDYYDVSLVDGYNVAISVVPVKGTGKCGPAGCVSDLNDVCPVGLAVRVAGRVVACRSACSAFGSARYCCTGEFGSRSQCGPTTYSRLFKTACPRAYSYAFDDRTSISTCSAVGYVVTFCSQYRMKVD